jgi:hypothetical protein
VARELAPVKTLDKDVKNVKRINRTYGTKLNGDSNQSSDYILLEPYTGELNLSGLIGTSNHSDMQRIRMIGFFFENRPHWQFEVALLQFTVCTYV